MPSAGDARGRADLDRGMTMRDMETVSAKVRSAIEELYYRESIGD
jgi:hypothetical protein